MAKVDEYPVYPGSWYTDSRHLHYSRVIEYVTLCSLGRGEQERAPTYPQQNVTNSESPEYNQYS